MKRTVSEFVITDLMFVALLSLSGVLSGFFSGIFSDLLYLASFLLPTVAFLTLRKNKNEESFKLSVSLTPRSACLFLLFAAPTVFGVMALSFLSSSLMGVIGSEGAVATEDTNFLYALILHAIAPAIFEEMLFRYLPLRALGNESPRLAVIYSAILFSLSHCNLFQIPYALFAGVMFAAIDIAAGSVLPSMLIHLVNNVLSLIWQSGGENDAIYILIISALALACLISLVVIWFKRKRLKTAFLPILQDKSKFIFTNSLGLFMIVTLTSALLSLAFSV